MKYFKTWFLHHMLRGWALQPASYSGASMSFYDSLMTSEYSINNFPWVNYSRMRKKYFKKWKYFWAEEQWQWQETKPVPTANSAATNLIADFANICFIHEFLKKLHFLLSCLLCIVKKEKLPPSEPGERRVNKIPWQLMIFKFWAD